MPRFEFLKTIVSFYKCILCVVYTFYSVNNSFGTKLKEKNGRCDFIQRIKVKKRRHCYSGPLRMLSTSQLQLMKTTNTQARTITKKGK